MTTALFALFLLGSCVVASAQSVQEQVLGQRLMQELGISIQCSSNLIIANQKLSEAEAEVKRLKEKYEPEQSNAK